MGKALILLPFILVFGFYVLWELAFACSGIIFALNKMFGWGGTIVIGFIALYIFIGWLQAKGKEARHRRRFPNDEDKDDDK